MNNISQQNTQSPQQCPNPPCQPNENGFYSLPQLIPGISENNPFFNIYTQQTPASPPAPVIPSQPSFPSTGTQNPSGSASTLAGMAPNPNIMNSQLASLQYLNGFLRTQIGRKVLVEFLIGTNTLVDRSGVLVAVGTNYILLNEAETDDIVACDYYNIKFIRFYY